MTGGSIACQFPGVPSEFLLTYKADLPIPTLSVAVELTYKELVLEGLVGLKVHALQTGDVVSLGFRYTTDPVFLMTLGTSIAQSPSLS